MELILVVCSLLFQEDKRAEAERLERKAAEAPLEKDRERYLAEAWALRADAFAEEGNFDAAREAWLKARDYGWTGRMPSGRSDRSDGSTLQDEDNPLGVPKPIRPKEKTLWDYFASHPYAGTRNGGSHSLIHLPPLEEAITYPADTWHASAKIDYTMVRFSETVGTGTSEWKTATISEIFEVDYAILNWLEVGIRLTTGEVFESGDDDLVLFQNNIQIIPADDRGFALESIIVRGKAAFPNSIVDFGLLVEFKIPTTDEKNFLTADTFDVAVSALFTKHFGGDWALHANVGMTLPIGETEFFRDNDDFSTLPDTNDVSSVVHFGVGVTWRIWKDFTLGLQVEGNTAVFQEVSVLDDSQFAATLHGRYKMAEDAFFSAALGTGFGDLSPDFVFSFSFDFLF